MASPTLPIKSKLASLNHVNISNSPYFESKKPSGRAGMKSRHPGISRRALGVHNTSCDINSLYENSAVIQAVEMGDQMQELTASLEVKPSLRGASLDDIGQQLLFPGAAEY